MHRLGAIIGTTALLLLAGLLIYAVTTTDPVLPELVVLTLVDAVLWLAADRASRFARPQPHARHDLGDNVIPLPVALDPETADAVRRIRRRLASSDRR
jgi:hypothetical protein